MPKYCTMADVARAAKVHPSTVSLALRNDPRLPVNTREQIQQLANTMGYRPNPMVSALIAERRKGIDRQYTATLAFLTAFPEREGWRKSPNYVALYQSLSQYAEHRGYRLEDFWLYEPNMTPERLRKILITRGIHGIIVAPLHGRNDTLDFNFSDFAAIAIGETLKSPRLDHVTVGYYDIVLNAMQQLRALNYGQIGFVTTRHIDQRVNHHSHAAYLVACQQTPVQQSLVLIDEDLSEGAFWRWYQIHKPEAILLSTRTEFQIALKIFQAKGLAIPDSVSLVNLDILHGQKESGILQNLEQEAAATIEWLTNRVERAQFGIPKSPQTVSVSGMWQQGWTTRLSSH